MGQMAKVSSTMLSVGTLLRRAEDTGAEVRVLVQGTWLDGRVLGCDGLGAVLDDGQGHQSLVRLDSVVAVTFSRTQLEDQQPAWAHAGGSTGPIEAGPVTVPPQSRGESHFLSPAPY
ncbi:hypothetical protein [Nocardioides sp. Soil774]|uniref:hypothetical protein n=1 Tax=Nocardioides sp. Soil774 TaxID=1736408 RepID=UPI0012F8BC5A|nr:hypothetical protein [Nocardioides sp. Soil774]